MNLLADGEQVATKDVTEADGWAYEFKDLPKFKDGQEIVYTVTENTVKDYTTKIEGYNITNTYNPGKISGTVTKRWEDANNQDGLRPDSIKIQLYANGKKQGQPVESTEKGHWTYSWIELDATDKDGKGIHYSIKEVDAVNGYAATITGENTGNL
ncbi:Cna B-type domain-containing protein, partial [Enterococcus faecalis]|nr:Cna B-type domain-containing protein [Enterococcus faecalis]